MVIARTPTRLDRVFYVVRGDGRTSAVVSAILIGFLAGILDASGKKTPLWQFVAIWPPVTLVVLAMRQRRTRILLAQLLLLGRGKPGSVDVVENPQSRTTTSPQVRRTRWVDAMSTPDAFYRSGFASMRQPNSAPLVVTPCNPRDVSRPGDLTQPLFLDQWNGQPLTVSFGKFLPRFELIRDLPRSNDSNHAFASRDVCYLPELGAELLMMAQPASPLARPEHCVDAALLAEHDLVIISGPDTNFWHAALYEGIARRFDQPESCVPLGAGLRDVSSAGVPLYGSSDLFVCLRHADDVLPRRPNDRGVIRLSEALSPTYGFILLATNPLSDPRQPRWCVFAAGLRSVGTMAAMLVLTSMLRAMRTGKLGNVWGGDVWSAVPVVNAPQQSYARAAVVLVRAATVEAAATVHERRARREIPHDRPDPLYRDSYVVTSAEILDTRGPEAVWRSVMLDNFSSDAAPRSV